MKVTLLNDGKMILLGQRLKAEQESKETGFGEIV